MANFVNMKKHCRRYRPTLAPILESRVQRFPQYRTDINYNCPMPSQQPLASSNRFNCLSQNNIAMLRAISQNDIAVLRDSHSVTSLTEREAPPASAYRPEPWRKPVPIADRTRHYHSQQNISQTRMQDGIIFKKGYNSNFGLHQNFNNQRFRSHGNLFEDSREVGCNVIEEEENRLGDVGDMTCTYDSNAGRRRVSSSSGGSRRSRTSTGGRSTTSAGGRSEASIDSGRGTDSETTYCSKPVGKLRQVGRDRPLVVDEGRVGRERSLHVKERRSERERNGHVEERRASKVQSSERKHAPFKDITNASRYQSHPNRLEMIADVCRDARYQDRDEELSAVPENKRRRWQGITQRKTSIIIHREKLKKQQEVEGEETRWRKTTTFGVEKEDAPHTSWKSGFGKLRKFASNMDLHRWRSAPNVKAVAKEEDEEWPLEYKSSRTQSDSTPSEKGPPLHRHRQASQENVKPRGVANRENWTRPQSMFVESMALGRLDTTADLARPMSMDIDDMLNSSSARGNRSKRDILQSKSQGPSRTASAWNLFKTLKQKFRLGSIEECSSINNEHVSDNNKDEGPECHLDFSFSPPVLWFPPPPVKSPSEERLI